MKKCQDCGIDIESINLWCKSCHMKRYPHAYG